MQSGGDAPGGVRRLPACRTNTSELARELTRDLLGIQGRFKNASMTHEGLACMPMRDQLERLLLMKKGFRSHYLAIRDSLHVCPVLDVLADCRVSCSLH